MDKEYVVDRMKNFSWDKATSSSDVKHGNIILNESAGPVEFVGIGKFEYRVALLNTSKLHRVPPHADERILLKLSIMDVDFVTAKTRIMKNV